MDGTHEDPTGLDELRAQRARLADRLRAPWWYLIGFAVVMALVCAVPFGAHSLGWGASWSGVFAIVVFYPLQAGLARASGVAIGTRTLRYPSGRAAGIALMVAVVAAVVAETVLLDHDRGGTAAVIGIFAVAVAVVCWQAHLRGIRRDLQSGTETGAV
ncbi:MAG: hypothetical protein ACRDMV_00300 [Streptosporangiales bacterium]